MFKQKKPIPFEFILEELASLEPWTRPMFGCTAVYVGDKIVLILRDKTGKDPDNGVWIATTTDHHASLKQDLPIMRSIKIFADGGPTGWQNLPSSSPDFEENALKVCQLIREDDERVGKVPKRKSKRSSRAGKSKSPSRKPKRR